MEIYAAIISGKKTLRHGYLLKLLESLLYLIQSQIHQEIHHSYYSTNE